MAVGEMFSLRNTLFRELRMLFCLQIQHGQVQDIGTHLKYGETKYQHSFMG